MAAALSEGYETLNREKKVSLRFFGQFAPGCMSVVTFHSLCFCLCDFVENAVSKPRNDLLFH